MNNDVYNIEAREQEPCGGVAKFVTRVKQIQKASSSDSYPPKKKHHKKNRNTVGPLIIESL